MRLSFSVILVETSLPQNVGSVARAMKTMGFYELILVQPKVEHVLEDVQAIALSSTAVDVLQNATIVPTLKEAIADCQIILGMSARKREISPVIETPVSFCEKILKLQNNSSLRIGLVFGNERVGLSNADLLHCTHQGLIPCNSEYSSLNLAQAVQIICYQLRQYFAKDLDLNLNLESNISAKNTNNINNVNPPQSKLEKEELATSEQIQQLLTHWQQAMEHIDFSQNKQNITMQRFQHLFHRQQLTQEEVQLLRGVCSKILK